MRTRRGASALGALLLCCLASACSRDFGDDAGSGGAGENGGESHSSGGSGGGNTTTGGSGPQDGSGGGATGGAGGDDGSTCSAGDRECVDATTLRTCTSEGAWDYEECASCSDGACLETISLCTDDKSSSTALRLEVTCDEETTVVDFQYAIADADGCMKTATALCVVGAEVTVTIAGSSSTMNPDGIFVGPSSGEATACASKQTCPTTMPTGPLFVRGRICDSDTDGAAGC